MIGALIIAGSIAALAWMAWAFVTAPAGWEDELGWHAGEPGAQDLGEFLDAFEARPEIQVHMAAARKELRAQLAGEPGDDQ